MSVIKEVFKAILAGLIVFLGLLIATAATPDFAFYLALAVLLVSLVAIFRPIPQIKLSSRPRSAMVAVAALLGLAGAWGFSKAEEANRAKVAAEAEAAKEAKAEKERVAAAEEARLMALRVSDPKAYLAAIRATKGDTIYVNEARALLRASDPQAFLEAIKGAMPEAIYLLELKDLDPAAWAAQEKARQDAEEANKKAEITEIKERLKQKGLTFEQQRQMNARLAELDPGNATYGKEIERLKVAEAKDKVAAIGRFRSFTEEAKRVSQALPCPYSKITPADSYGGALYGCIQGPAETAKFWINETKGKSGQVENVKVMWNEWTKDVGYGLAPDKSTASHMAAVLADLYAPQLKAELVRVFNGRKPATFRHEKFEITYELNKGPAIDEHLLTVSQK
ncbi:hypothetical protein GAY28_01545 [Azospirillum brasilense]|nr:hypothetical protein [Azospirillum brasilense]